MRAKLNAACLVVLLACFGCGRSKPSIAGEWTLYQGKAVDVLTLQEKDGVLSGQIKLDPAYVGGTSDVHGILAGTNVELLFDSYFTSTTPGDSGDVHYTFKGTVDGGTMAGSFSVLGPFSSQISNPNETSLWTAQRKN